MLVLSRKQGQTLNIGEGITVTVLGIHGGVLKLGIDAPKSVRILRGELHALNEPVKRVQNCETAPAAVAV